MSVTIQLQSNCNREIETENGAKCVPNQLSVAEEEGQKKQQYGMIQGLLTESNCLREELHNLRCLTQIKAEERGQKHRELLRAEVQNTHTHTHKSTFKIHFDIISSTSNNVCRYKHAYFTFEWNRRATKNLKNTILNSAEF